MSVPFLQPKFFAIRLVLSALAVAEYLGEIYPIADLASNVLIYKPKHTEFEILVQKATLHKQDKF